MDRAIVTTSWDDGHPADLKLAELLMQYNIPATFYIPIDNMERECMNPRQIDEIAQRFDVGGHSYHHVNLAKISPREAEKEVLEGKKALEQIIGREVLPFCYPWGSFKDETVNIVKRAGFIGARTVKLMARKIKDPFRIGTTIYTADPWLSTYLTHSIASRDLSLAYFMLRNNLFFKSWDQVAIKTLDFVVSNGGIWHLWGHSWEIVDNNDWARLEKVLQQICRLSKKTERTTNSQLIRICADKKVTAA